MGLDTCKFHKRLWAAQMVCFWSLLYLLVTMAREFFEASNVIPIIHFLR